ncbi:hypothetical protein Tco_0831928 [Tanacetum coccineum]
MEAIAILCSHMILGSLNKFKKRIPKELKPRSKDTRRTSGNTTRNDLFPPFLIIEAQTQDECPTNKHSNVVKNMMKPSQNHRGVPVGPKVGFQPTKQVYRQVSKKNNVSTSGNKKKNMEPTKEGKPLTRVDPLGDHDSEDEVASVENDMANSGLKDVGYGTNTLLKQWKDSYGDGEYGYDIYNDDI